MKSRVSDTGPQAEKLLIEGLRKMPVWQKLQRVCELNEALHQLAMADIRRRHPRADERERALRLASRRLPPELMRTVFGWDPEVEGF
jgi:hypothetical protein